MAQKVADFEQYSHLNNLEIKALKSHIEASEANAKIVEAINEQGILADIDTRRRIATGEKDETNIICWFFRRDKGYGLPFKVRKHRLLNKNLRLTDSGRIYVN